MVGQKEGGRDPISYNRSSYRQGSKIILFALFNKPSKKITLISLKIKDLLITVA